jgi:hypothetical protein
MQKLKTANSSIFQPETFVAARDPQPTLNDWVYAVLLRDMPRVEFFSRVKTSYKTASKFSQSHGLGYYSSIIGFVGWRRAGNKRSLLHACFWHVRADDSPKHARWNNLSGFGHPEKICFTKQLACIVSGSQLIGLLCLGTYFFQTRLHKTHDFGQIQNPLDLELGWNGTITSACRVMHFVVKKQGEQYKLNLHSKKWRVNSTRKRVKITRLRVKFTRLRVDF